MAIPISGVGNLTINGKLDGKYACLSIEQRKHLALLLLLFVFHATWPASILMRYFWSFLLLSASFLRCTTL